MDGLDQLLYRHYVKRFKGDNGGCTRAFSRRNIHWLRKRLLPLLGGVDLHGRILEVGCGAGQLLGFLKDQGFANCLGVDISSEQVAEAKAAGRNVRHGDALIELGHFQHELDVIIAVDFIEHLSRELLPHFGNSCLQALRPGGLLLMQTPNGEGLHAGHAIFGDLTHRTIFNESSMTQYLRSLGFDDIVCQETGPTPYGLLGIIQWCLWQVARTGALVSIVAETGRRPRILTQTLLCRAKVPDEHDADKTSSNE